jgi:hypothetical protein
MHKRQVRHRHRHAGLHEIHRNTTDLTVLSVAGELSYARLMLHRDDLLKPDLLCEILLLGSGVVIAVILLFVVGASVMRMAGL